LRAVVTGLRQIESLETERSNIMSRRIFFKVLLVAVAILGLLALSGVLSAQGRNGWTLERVREVQERHTGRLMAIEGVVGTAVGLDQNDRPAVKVLLAESGVRGIPRSLDGVPVQPIVTGKIYALKGPPEGKGPKEKVDPTDRFDRPVPIGISTGHPAVTAGTIGCRVTDGTDVFALSNNHVYAVENQATLGDAVIQPGAFDGGSSPTDDIGALDDFETIVFYDFADPPDPIPTNEIDAAIALSSTAELDNATPSDGYGIPGSETVEPRLHQIVKKYGRTTGLTKGQVWALNVTVDVIYDSGVARFVGQIRILPLKGEFTSPGDSGSLVVTQKRNPVGLVFAGGEVWTFANPIDAVLSRFGVTVDGE
jgi:hypothetical protein